MTQFLNLKIILKLCKFKHTVPHLRIPLRPVKKTLPLRSSSRDEPDRSPRPNSSAPSSYHILPSLTGLFSPLNSVASKSRVGLREPCQAFAVVGGTQTNRKVPKVPKCAAPPADYPPVPVCERTSWSQSVESVGLLWVRDSAPVRIGARPGRSKKSSRLTGTGRIEMGR